MPALATPRLGKDSVIYRNTGSFGSPTLVALTNCKGVKVPKSMGEDDVTARLTGGVEAFVATLLKVGLTFQMHDDDGTDITAIRTLFHARTPIEMWVMNGIATNTATRGVRMSVQVFKFEESQENDKANMFDVELKPTWPIVGATASAEAVSGNGSLTIS